MNKKYITREEANDLLKELYDLRQRSLRSKRAAVEYERYKEICAKKFDFLVERKTRRYRSFANYEDLKQDGRLALMLALNSYKPGKGDFIFWANQYIKTKISREANRHSTIRIPIKHARHIQPYKVSQLPIIIDGEADAVENIENDELRDAVQGAISRLPELHRKVIMMHYEFSGYKDNSIAKICEQMKISRGNCITLLNEAKQALKESLQNLNG